MHMFSTADFASVLWKPISRTKKAVEVPIKQTTGPRRPPQSIHLVSFPLFVSGNKKIAEARPVMDQGAKQDEVKPVVSRMDI